MSLYIPTARIAHPSDDFDSLLRFHYGGLGLTVLDKFEDHHGIDGIMPGGKGAPYHFECTKTRRHSAARAPTQGNLLVFYHPNAKDWDVAVQRMGGAGFAPIPSFHPFWDRDGLVFEGPDGYRIVLQNMAWDG